MCHGDATYVISSSYCNTSRFIYIFIYTYINLYYIYSLYFIYIHLYLYSRFIYINHISYICNILYLFWGHRNGGRISTEYPWEYPCSNLVNWLNQVKAVLHWFSGKKKKRKTMLYHVILMWCPMKLKKGVRFLLSFPPIQYIKWPCFIVPAFTNNEAPETLKDGASLGNQCGTALDGTKKNCR